MSVTLEALFRAEPKVFHLVLRNVSFGVVKEISRGGILLLACQVGQ